MSSSNVVFRVFLLAQPLRVTVPDHGPGGGYRVLGSAEVDAMFSGLHWCSVPLSDMSPSRGLVRGWPGGSGVCEAVREERNLCLRFRPLPTLLRAFWRAVLVLRFEAGFAADVGTVPHTQRLFQPGTPLPGRDRVGPAGQYILQ